MATLGESKPAETVVKIAASASDSGILALEHGCSLTGVITPAVWDAADITFRVSNDGTTFYPLFDAAGDEVVIPSASVAIAEARAFALLPENFAGWNYVKIRSGTNALAVNQSAIRSLKIASRPVS